MKKIMKSTLAVALVAAAGYGGVKTYGTYASISQSDQLLSDNVEALGFGYEFHYTFPRYEPEAEIQEIPCKTHEEVYEEVQTINGKKQIITHTITVVDSYETTCTRTANIITGRCDRDQELDCNGNRKNIF